MHRLLRNQIQQGTENSCTIFKPLSFLILVFFSKLNYFSAATLDARCLETQSSQELLFWNPTLTAASEIFPGNSVSMQRIDTISRMNFWKSFPDKIYSSEFLPILKSNVHTVNFTALSEIYRGRWVFVQFIHKLIDKSSRKNCDLVTVISFKVIPKLLYLFWWAFL